MGFGVPLAAWFRGELRELLRDTLGSPRAAQRGWLQPREVARLLDVHESGRRDVSARLWALLWLELWAREWLDGDGGRASVGA
jgi:asparagine synthase (glutamine-hydrolysing)